MRMTATKIDRREFLKFVIASSYLLLPDFVKRDRSVAVATHELPVTGLAFDGHGAHFDGAWVFDAQQVSITRPEDHKIHIPFLSR